MTPQEWISRLQTVSKDASTRTRPINYWTIDDLDGEICVFENNTKRYTLQPSNDLLEHEVHDSPGCSLFTVNWNPEAPKEATDLYECMDDSEACDAAASAVMQIQRLDGKYEQLTMGLTPCVFVALGWLIEHEKSKTHQTQKRTTNLVVMLNLSTDPTSIWLMFDYHMVDYLEEQIRWTNQLGDYHNRLYRHGGREQDFKLKVEDDFVPYESRLQGKYYNFHQRYTNLPSTNYNSTQIGDAAIKASCQDNDQHLGDGFSQTCDDPDAAQPADNRSADRSNTPPTRLPDASVASPSTSSSDKRPLSDSVGTVASNPNNDSADKDDGGYFGLPRHDLVLLAPDIDAWSTAGLEQSHVKLCLENTRVYLGSSLQAATATIEEEERLQNGRIDIKDLCFR
ncbi:MAG: hypothetical protein Q9166_006361 [cf. Caloplaca sp. 2 TL-2023]